MKAINSHVGAWSPMAEQHATAKFLLMNDAVDEYLSNYKKELEERLQLIYKGFQQLKSEGFSVDACAPQAAIYLTIQLSLVSKTTCLPDRQANNGDLLSTQSDVTSYILNEAKLAVVPFYAFGAPKDSDWYRLSVGTCKKEEIPEMLAQLREALQKLK
jgi:aspartate aminotransferase